MSRRVSLTDLAGDIASAEPASSEAAPAAEQAAAAAPKTAAQRPAGGVEAPTLRSVEAKPPSASRGRIFDQFDRKEARLRSEQYQQLTDVSRGLNRLRHREGERITENTLIRVAVDLLLARQDDLAGNTEDELRRSVGL
jgi:hypothetical protein